MRRHWKLAGMLALIVPGSARADSSWAWETGKAPVRMEPSGTSMCLLHRVAGRLSGAGEFIRVVDDGTSWVLEGQAKSGRVEAGAYCVPIANFSPKAGERWHREWKQNWSGVMGRASCVQNVAQASNGATATFISSIGGQFRGTGEFVEVKVPKIRNAPTEWVSGTCRDAAQTGPMVVAVTSFQTPHSLRNRKVRMVGPNGTRLIDLAGEWRVDRNGAVPLARTSEGFCGLTYVAGSFLSQNDQVGIHAADGRWRLSVRSTSGGTYAGARCVAYQQ
jgi:hypothetical protein